MAEYVNESGEFVPMTWEENMKDMAQSNNHSVFSDWLFPQKKEERQIGQQLLLAENEPKARMKGMIDAGINPLTAAREIAGTPPSSVPQSAASTNPIGDVVGAAAGIASGFDSIAGAAIGLSKLAPEVDNIKADTASKFAGIGLTNAQTQGVLTDNMYKDEDWLSRLNVQRQQFENMKQELTNMRATHREIMTHCDEMISQIELNGSVKDYNEALMAKVHEESRWMKELNDWRISHNLHIVDSGIDGYIFDMALNGADISQFDNFIDIYSSYRGSVQRSISDAQNSSEVQYAYQISNARKNGENASDVLYGRIGSWADAIGRASSVIGGHLDNVVNGISDNIKGLSGNAKGKSIREELTMILNNAFEQLDKFPEDRERLNGVINDIQAALQLSNRELVQWYEKSN